MTLYTDAATETLIALAEYGAPLTFTKIERGTQDPVTGKFPEPIKNTFSPDAVYFDYTSKNSGTGVIEGTTIKKGDKKILIGATSYTPESGDTVLIGGVNYNVINFTSIAPTGTPILYEIQARK